MESFPNNESSGLEFFRRQLERMTTKELEREFLALQDKHHLLGHREVFADSAIDITSEQAFVEGVGSYAAIEEVELKMAMVEKELQGRHLKKAA